MFYLGLMPRLGVALVMSGLVVLLVLWAVAS